MSEDTASRNSKKKLKVTDLIVTLAIPIVVCQITALYFGTNYSAHPGDGYGYGLSLALIFTLLTFIRFLWKYRGHEEDESREGDRP